ncbi:hypothetical protein LTR62_005564 [Meristemomyces frigidus]|uniref:ER membrane protein complex subunit 2 n=1 Tax=Meristemomyces frigidus TaxID=1508187 RepID=A0AAN7YQS3_9PEZI|nr:hypothetical protein LTR62_005564 [Meristemomyces frigidus]
MATSLLVPPTNTTPEQSLALSNFSTTFFASQKGWRLPYPLSLFLNTESQEKWTTYENIFLATLRTGDHAAAYLCLEELTDRFGKGNEHIIALQGMYQEATAKDTAELEEVMRRYDELLREDPALFSVRKRRAALLKSVGRPVDAIGDLVSLVDASPTDAEAWAELADLYAEQGSFEQAVFCLEEVVLVTPNAWNMHARLAELIYMGAQKLEGGEQLKALSESMRRFCRSIELCDGYLRGYVGLKVTTGQLLQTLEGGKKSQLTVSDPTTGDLAPPSLASVKKLNALATAKLGEIVRRGSAGEKGWDGYSPVELQAARQVLDRDTQKIER